jgi:ubiquinone/menaquinone biosynthesis C-methylase UbiE
VVCGRGHRFTIAQGPPYTKKQGAHDIRREQPIATLGRNCRTKLGRWIYGLKPVHGILRRRAADLIDRLCMLDNLHPNMTHLDVGSGTGHVPLAIATAARTAPDMTGIRIIGIDPRAEPSKHVLRQLPDGPTRIIQFLRASGTQLPIADASADQASTYFVLHHIPYDAQLRVLAEVRRVLKAGAHWYIWEDTPRTDWEYRANERWDRRLNFEPSAEPHFYRQADDWRKLLTEHGFDVRRQAYYEDQSRWPGEGRIRHTGFVLQRV